MDSPVLRRQFHCLSLGAAKIRFGPQRLPREVKLPSGGTSEFTSFNGRKRRELSPDVSGSMGHSLNARNMSTDRMRLYADFGRNVGE